MLAKHFARTYPPPRGQDGLSDPVRARSRWSGGLGAWSALACAVALASGCGDGGPGPGPGDGAAGSVTGTVYAGQGTTTPLPGIPVQCASRTGTSGAAGAYAVTGLTAGTHALSVSVAGYQPYTADVIVTAENATAHDIHLVPNPSTAQVNSSGGTVTSPSGLATLVLPQGAIEGDLEVTITEPAQEPGSCAPPLIEILPGDTALNMPARLTVRYGAGAPPESATADDAVIAWLPPQGPAAPGALPTPPVVLGTTTAAGVASADIVSLGRYVVVWIPRCPIDPGGETIVKTATSCVHWAFAAQDSEGAGTSSIVTSNFGRMMVSAEVPVGAEGSATTQVSMGLWFRSVRGSSGATSTENGDITVRLSHAAQAQSDFYQVTIGVDTSAPYRAVIEDAQGGNVTSGGAVAFWQLFQRYPAFMFADSYPYQPQSATVSMGGCHLEADTINMVAVHLTAIAHGSEAVDTLPPAGGEVSFYPDGLRIDEIAVGCSA